jgi:sulfite reductase beta subunit-like hemoprotein
MLGGSTGEGARFARLTAKVPARRVPQVIERLIAMYVERRNEGETADHFFGRLDVAEGHSLLADLERITAQDAVPTDFIDLGEAAEFAPEVLDGECSA